jgi:UDP-N-acetylglucosamine--dolichyl-phosphate N-acetylglucosaminephosphotransferase
VPCPQHHLPHFNQKTGLMEPLTFPCKAHEYKWLKQKPNDEQVINMTVINLCLQLLEPMSEWNLCLCLLFFQVICCSIGFACRYYVAGLFFEN